MEGCSCFEPNDIAEFDYPILPKWLAEHDRELLDKVAERIKGRWLFRGTDGNPYRDTIDEVIAELKAEVNHETTK